MSSESSRNRKSGLKIQPGLEITLQTCKLLLKEIDTPRALSIFILIENAEWDTLAVGLPIDALWYCDAESFFLDYQATKLLTKADFLPTSFSKETEALVRFESAEALCQETNRRWRSFYVDGLALPESDVDRIVSIATRKIHMILGRFPEEKLLENCRWGPGATTSIRNPRTSVYDKYLEPMTGSGLCFTRFGPLLDQVTLWKDFREERPYYCVSEGNKVVFVPKDAKTFRSIAAEPSVDSFIQLGIGRLMRDRLRAFGLDLSSQELNRDLARYGSLTGKVATVDLSMASDTVSKIVVEHMFPVDWLEAMKCVRSASWRRGRDAGVYSKFSSMGNGYTFEMETILFYAIALAVAEDLRLPFWEVCAFGDDLTISVEGLDLLERSLVFCGFKVNKTKSFGFGPFRESCGKDYFFGTNVRPYFVRSVLRSPLDIYKFHNGILRGLVKFKRTAEKLIRYLEPEERLFGPNSLGDNVLNSDTPRGWFMPASKRYPMFEGFIVRQKVFKPEKESVSFYEPAVLASLHSNAESPSKGMKTLRDRGTWVTKTALVASWD